MRQTKSAVPNCWWLMSVSSSLTAALPLTQTHSKTKKKPVSNICGRIPTSLAENDPAAAESMAMCSWGKASKTRDNSALCLVISLAECAPSEGVTHGATNGRRKRRAVKALEIDVLLDAPGRENRGKTQQKLHVQSYLLPGACDVREREVERSGAVVHCQCKFSKNSIGSLLPPQPHHHHESLRHWIHIMGFLHTLFIFLPGVGAEWSEGKSHGILFFLFSTALKTTPCAFQTIGGAQLRNNCTTPCRFLYINPEMDGEKERSNRWGGCALH